MKAFDIEGAIVSAFEAVRANLQALGEHIKTELSYFPIWVDNGAGELVHEHERAIEALKSFKVIEGLLPQETVACIGALGCKVETLPFIDNVNKAKDKLRSIVDLYLEHYQADRSRDTKVIRDLLAAQGYPLIKLKQVYRHIRYLPFHPRRISFNLATHSSHKVITRKQAEGMLLKVGQGENIEVQLNLLNMLDSKEKLVVCRDIAQCWTVNVATFKGQDGRSKTELYRTSIPLFYVHNHAFEPTKVGFSKKSNRYKQAPRTDKQIEDSPFLSSISAYRYKSP